MVILTIPNSQSQLDSHFKKLYSELSLIPEAIQLLYVVYELSLY